MPEDGMDARQQEANELLRKALPELHGPAIFREAKRIERLTGCWPHIPEGDSPAPTRDPIKAVARLPKAPRTPVKKKLSAAEQSRRREWERNRVASILPPDNPDDAWLDTQLKQVSKGYYLHSGKNFWREGSPLDPPPYLVPMLPDLAAMMSKAIKDKRPLPGRVHATLQETLPGAKWTLIYTVESPDKPVSIGAQSDTGRSVIDVIDICHRWAMAYYRGTKRRHPLGGLIEEYIARQMRYGTGQPMRELKIRIVHPEAVRLAKMPRIAGRLGTSTWVQDVSVVAEKAWNEGYLAASPGVYTMHQKEPPRKLIRTKAGTYQGNLFDRRALNPINRVPLYLAVHARIADCLNDARLYPTLAMDCATVALVVSMAPYGISIPVKYGARLLARDSQGRYRRKAEMADKRRFNLAMEMLHCMVVPIHGTEGMKAPYVAMKHSSKYGGTYICEVNAWLRERAEDGKYHGWTLTGLLSPTASARYTGKGKNHLPRMITAVEFILGQLDEDKAGKWYPYWGWTWREFLWLCGEGARSKESWVWKRRREMLARANYLIPRWADRPKEQGGYITHYDPGPAVDTVQLRVLPGARVQTRIHPSLKNKKPGLEYISLAEFLGWAAPDAIGPDDYGGWGPDSETVPHPF